MADMRAQQRQGQVLNINVYNISFEELLLVTDEKLFCSKFHTFLSRNTKRVLCMLQVVYWQYFRSVLTF